ncbi:MAG: Heptaprenyl diphosphate synthase component 2 [Phycisphaerae bacterium]|nr:Heptaprenyl diphosphate synthase component 2 [Phycisphaerae bacterium]
MLQLTDLHTPVAAGLARVRQIIRDELHSDRPAVRELCAHVERYHGKMIRPTLLLLSGEAAGRVTDDHLTLAAVIEIIHLATLVHDDVLDEADVRRALPTVSRRWGNEQAVLLGDFLISHAFALCSSLDSQAASRLVGLTTNTVCEGEMMQVAQRGRLELDEPGYYDIIARKTAALIRTACVLGARHASADERTVDALGRFGQSVGIAFQIADDLLDLLGDEAETGKSTGRDLDMGKLTLPVIHHLRTADPRTRKESLTLLRSSGALARREFVERLESTESLDYARDAARSHVDAALEALTILPESDARSILRAMAEFIIDRRR